MFKIEIPKAMLRSPTQHQAESEMQKLCRPHEESTCPVTVTGVATEDNGQKRAFQRTKPKATRTMKGVTPGATKT